MNIFKTITDFRLKKLCFGSKELKLFILFKYLCFLAFILFLLIFLILPIQSSFVSIQFRKKMLRKEIKRKIIAGLNEDELVLLKFAEVDLLKKLKWKHSKEFEFNGEMYDIVTVKKTKDSIEYHCWWDSEESLLNRKLMALVGLNLADLPDNRELQFNLSNFYKTIYFKQESELEIFHYQNNILSCRSDIFFQKPEAILSGFNSNNSPPPEIFIN